MGSRKARRSDDPSIVGALFIDKPAGMTSHDVVARVRRVLGVRRVGHAGTLDPMATGVLVIGVGPTTRLLGIVGAHDKEYTATVRLGAATTTDDSEGEVIGVADPDTLASISDSAIETAVGGFIGTIAQRPSAVSAVKIDGKRAYERVREGQDVELPERTVTVTAFEVRGIDRVPGFVDVQVRVECSAGTYIRALARDLGAALCVGGHLTALRRTRSGGVRVTQCRSIDEVGLDALMAPADFAQRELPSVAIDRQMAAKVRNGIQLDISAMDPPTKDESPIAVIGPDHDLVAVATVQGEQLSYLVVLPPVVGSADRE